MSRADDDLTLWYQWNQAGKPTEQLAPLIRRFDGMVNKQLNVYKSKGGISGNIPEPALKAEIQNNLVDAFDTYNPNMGAQLATHAQNHLKKTHRYYVAHQNVARITEPYVNRIGEFNRTQSSLQEGLGRPPTVIELADKLKWPMSHVETMQKSIRRDLSPHSFQADPVSIRTSRFEEVKSLIPYELTPQENAVFELLMMSPDKPISKLEIASKLNISPSRVSKINKKIAEKMKGYLYG